MITLCVRPSFVTLRARPAFDVTSLSPLPYTRARVVKEIERGREYMADETQNDEQGGAEGGGAQGGGSEKQSGDPGRTPGTAEGDEETVDESLRQKES